MSRGRITPRRETPEKDAKPRRAEPVLVGHYFPGDRIETITIRGDNVGAQLMKIGLPRLAAFNALKAEVPQLLTGFELLEQKAHLIVDPQNQASFAQRFLTAARALDDVGAEALVEALGSPPWSPPPGGGPVPDDEAALADFRGRIAGLGTMSSVFRGAQRSIDAARVEVAHAASLLDLEARPVARGEMVERARTGLERLVGELQSRGNDLVAEVKVYASAWSSLDVFLRAAGKVVPRVHFINLPGGMAGIRSKSLEASFAGDAREIAQALEDLKVPWIDILPVEPVGDLAAFDVFSEHLDIFPTVYGTLLYNFNGYDGPAGLLKAAAETPPQGRVGHAHLAAIAGRGATNNGYPFALNVAAAGLRLVLDEVMGGPNEYGALTPLFGETDGRIYSGLGEVDTLGFSFNHIVNRNQTVSVRYLYRDGQHQAV